MLALAYLSDKGFGGCKTSSSEISFFCRVPRAALASRRAAEDFEIAALSVLQVECSLFNHQMIAK